MTHRPDMTGAVAHPHPGVAGKQVAAIVGERVITVAQVDARLAELRNGPLAGRLPHPHTAEGRNLRRWLVQVMVTELLVEQEAARHGLAPTGRGPMAGDGTGSLTLAAALRTGGVAAAVLAAMPVARALCRTVTAGCEPAEDDIRDYYRRNLDRFTTPETRWVSSLGPIRRGEIAGPIEDAVFAAREGDTVGPVDGPGGPWTLVVERVEGPRREPYDKVRQEIRRELGEGNQERAFARWLDERHAAAVRLMPGYEHPADSAHPDATHRH